MNAAMFFRVFGHARKLHLEERAIMMAELCDVVSIGGVATVQHYKEVKKIFSERIFGKRKRKAMSLTDPKTAHILASAFWAGRVR
jgi:hypothetical protein